jgi:hypothetical protein
MTLKPQLRKTPLLVVVLAAFAFNALFGATLGALLATFPTGLLVLVPLVAFLPESLRLISRSAVARFTRVKISDDEYESFLREAEQDGKPPMKELR